MTDDTQHYYITPPTMFLPADGMRISIIGVDEDWIEELGDGLEDTLPNVPMTFYHLDKNTANQWQWQFHMVEQSNLVMVNVAEASQIDLLTSFLLMGENKLWFYVDPDTVDKDLIVMLNTVNANVFTSMEQLHAMLRAFIGNE